MPDIGDLQSRLGRLAGPLAGALRLVDSRFGPIRLLTRRKLEPPHPEYWLFSAALSRCPVGSLRAAQPVTAAGVSIDEGVALRRALGEAVERYAALNPRLDSLPRRLKLRQSPMFGRFPRCAQDEPVPESLRSPDPEALVTHVRVQPLGTTDEIAIPAAYVALHYHPRRPEPLLTHAISTGVAFHTDVRHAIWSGTLEVLERDALMRAWWSGRGIRILRADHAPTSLDERLRRVEARGLRAGLFHLDTPASFHTVLAVLRSDVRPYTTVGCACLPGAADAASKALDEAVAIRVACEAPSSNEVVPRPVNHLMDHARLYADWASPEPIDRLRASTDTCSLGELALGPPLPESAEDLASLGRRLSACGLTALWTDLTPEDVAPLGHVVRVVIPEAVPLSQSSSARWLASPRLRDALAGRAPNPHPHPFA